MNKRYSIVVGAIAVLALALNLITWRTALDKDNSGEAASEVGRLEQPSRAMHQFPRESQKPAVMLVPRPRQHRAIASLDPPSKEPIAGGGAAPRADDDTDAADDDTDAADDDTDAVERQARIRNDLTILRLERQRQSEATDEAASQMQRLAYRRAVSRVANVPDPDVDCTSSLCKITVQTPSVDALIAVKLMRLPEGVSRIVRARPPASAESTGSIEIYQMATTELTSLNGGSPDGVVGPGLGEATSPSAGRPLLPDIAPPTVPANQPDAPDSEV